MSPPSDKISASPPVSSGKYYVLLSPPATCSMITLCPACYKAASCSLLAKAAASFSCCKGNQKEAQRGREKGARHG